MPRRRRTETAKKVVEQTKQLRETGRVIFLLCQHSGEGQLADQVAAAVERIGNEAMILVAAAEVLRDK